MITVLVGPEEAETSSDATDVRAVLASSPLRLVVRVPDSSDTPSGALLLVLTIDEACPPRQLHIGTHNTARTLIPVMHMLYESGRHDEARAIAQVLGKHFTVTEGWKLLVKSDLDLGHKSFVDAMRGYLRVLRLSRKKRRNYPIDHNFLLQLFQLAQDKQLFIPIAEESLCEKYVEMEVVDLMILMSENKETLHLRGELLSALYVRLGRSHFL